MSYRRGKFMEWIETPGEVDKVLPVLAVFLLTLSPITIESYGDHNWTLVNTAC